ncbi:MAG: hypothetical protein DRN07_08015 [Thermoplasmata archaeon]|nr:MAG: hypothetical protein DRN07_08015 [Thermoplasmata archaeon]
MILTSLVVIHDIRCPQEGQGKLVSQMQNDHLPLDKREMLQIKIHGKLAEELSQVVKLISGWIEGIM